MNENVLRTSAKCMRVLIGQTNHMSVILLGDILKKDVFGHSDQARPFPYSYCKNPKCFLWYQLNIRKIKRLEWPDFLLQGYQKQPDCVLVIFIDPKIMKLFSWYKPIIWKFEFKVFNKQFIYCWFSIFFPKKCVILIKHVLLHVSLHYLSPINSNLISSHF